MTYPNVPTGFQSEPVAMPCPHCSNEWSKALYDDKPNGIARIYYVRCERCGARGPEKHANRFNFAECEEQLKHAIREWNRRCRACTHSPHKRQAPLQVEVSAVGNESFYLPEAPHVMANLIWRVHHRSRDTGEYILEAVNGTSIYKPEIVLPPNALVEPIDSPKDKSHGRATNIDEEDIMPGIQPDENDSSLYHMHAAYADVQLGQLIINIDASYPDKLILGLHEWSGDVATCRFEVNIPVYDEAAP